MTEPESHTLADCAGSTRSSTGSTARSANGLTVSRAGSARIEDELLLLNGIVLRLKGA